MYETAWLVLLTLHEHGSLNKNQIINKTKGVSRQTTYNALPILEDEGLIFFDENNSISLNKAKFLGQNQLMQIYNEYDDLGHNLDSMFERLEKRLEKHKAILDPQSKEDADIIRNALTKPPYNDLISSIVHFFELGSVMDFHINTGFFTKTIEKRALAVRKKNEKVVSRVFKLLQKAEPTLWREMLMMINYRLSSKIISK